MGNIEETNMTWKETPAEAFRKRLEESAKQSEEISKKIIADCERRQKDHDEWLMKKGMEENE
jgi:hypothetical protein